MMTATRTITSHDGYSLVKHDPQGEIRIEHAASGQCSDWLHHSDVMQIEENPALMADWNLDCELDAE